MKKSLAPLPDTLPTFIVDDIMLLPGGHAPMHVLTKGDTNVILDALATNSRMVGILMQNNVSSKEFKIGCAGKITAFDEMSDGSFFITLTGISRFKINEEVPNIRGYKRFSVDWSDYENDVYVDSQNNIDLEKLIDLIKEYAEKFDIDMDWEILTEMPNFNIITFFSMSIPFDNSQRQKLLEAQDINLRAEILTKLLKNQL